MYTGFINNHKLDRLCDIINDNDFPWKLVKNITGRKEDGPGLVHPIIKEEGVVTSDEVLQAVKDVVMSIPDYRVEDIFRIKLNCLLKDSNHITYNNKHIDQDFDHNAMILYLNDSDGDTLLYDGDNIINRSSPQKGKYIIFNGLIDHASTRPVDNTYRFVLNINFQPDDNFIIDQIKKITKTLPHYNQSLFDHLVGTYTILKKIGAPRYVRLAGLCHSIYGTATYNNNAVDIKERDNIKSIIGPAAEELAFTFCTLDRTPESYRSIEEEKQHDLLLIEYANLIDQNHNGEHNKVVNSIMHRITELQKEDRRIDVESY